MGEKLWRCMAEHERWSIVGKARWEPIAEIKAARKIPVIGNGDVKTPDDIDLMINETGVDGVMIGRAATGNPWIFQRRNKTDVPKDELVETIKEHLRLMVKHYGEERGVTVFSKTCDTLFK